MRILVLTTSYPTGPDEAGGIFIQYLLHALKRRGHELRVVMPQRSRPTRGERVLGIPVWQFRYSLARRPPSLTATPGGMPEALRQDPRAILQVPGMLAGFAAAAMAHADWADLIHANWLGAGLIGSLVRLCTGVPLVLTLRGDDSYLIRDRLLWRTVGRWVFRSCSAVTSVSANMAPLVSPYLPARLGSVVVPTFGVDVDRFHPPERRRSAAEDGPPVGLFVGNVSRAKGVDVLLTALGQCGRAWGRFVFVGGGGEVEAMRKQARQLGLADRIDWAGPLPPATVADLMRRVDFLVLPSLSEGRPNVVVEAMASGLPVIATAVGGVPELIADGRTGLLVPPGRAGPLADALGRLCRRRGLRTRLGAAACRHVHDQDLTWDRTAAEFEALFARATGRPGRGGLGDRTPAG